MNTAHRRGKIRRITFGYSVGAIVDGSPLHRGSFHHCHCYDRWCFEEDELLWRRELCTWDSYPFTIVLRVCKCSSLGLFASMTRAFPPNLTLCCRIMETPGRTWFKVRHKVPWHLIIYILTACGAKRRAKSGRVPSGKLGQLRYLTSTLPVQP